MYQDHQPCQVCGAPVDVRPRRTPTRTVADDTVDERVCTNASCPSRSGAEDAPSA